MDQLTSEAINGLLDNENLPMAVAGLDFSFNEPIVIVVNQSQADLGHKIYDYNETTHLTSKLSNYNNAYSELEKITNYVIFRYMEKYYELYNEDDNFVLRIPRINMIGHSRGGILNMQYAIEHPDVVDSLYSVGTPYYGSLLYEAIRSYNLDICDQNNGINGYNNEVMRDCVDPNTFFALQHYWNEYQETDGSRHTKLYAIAGTMGIDLVKEAINNYDISNIGNRLSNAIKAAINLTALNYADGINKHIDNDILSSIYNPYSVGDLLNSYPYLIDVCDFFQISIDLINFFMSIEIIQNISDSNLIAIIGRVFAGLLKTMVYDYQNNKYVMKNDGLIDIYSQQAYNYKNVVTFEKIFTRYNYDISNTSNDEIVFAHNLEQQDEDIINCILSNIVLGNGDNGFNIKKINSNVYEYIGFSYNKAVENGVLIFDDLMDGGSYHISSKMFDCDYTLAQKLYKNRYDNYFSLLNRNSTDGINEIYVKHSCTIDDNTFAFLKGQVKFRAYLNDNFILNSTGNTYMIDDGSLYNGRKLLKFGKNNYNTLTSFTIENVEEIGVGAFLGQPIQNLTIDNSNCTNIDGLIIDNYAFYGCSRLESVNTVTDIDYVGTYSFSHSKMHSGKKEVIINNALIKAKSDTPLYVNGNSTYNYIAPLALTNYQYNYVVIDNDNVVFERNSLLSSKLDNIIIYSAQPQIDNYAFSKQLPNIYSARNLSGVFNNITIQNTIDITLLKPNEQPITKSLVLDTTYQDPNVIFTQNELSITGYNGIGYVINDDNVYYNEVMTSVNFFQYANEELHLYYECSVSHQSNITPTNHSYHIIECVNCMKKEKVDHTYVITEIIENNEIDDRCHQLKCNVCNATKEDFHTIQFGLIDINNELYYGRMCTECEFESPITHITVTDNGENHLLSNGEYLPHDYITIYYQNKIDIQVCKYCGHHVHKGIPGASDGPTTHSLYCYYCDTIVHIAHTFGNYENQDNVWYNGYHTKECTICGQGAEEAHNYAIDDNYEDGHHLICTLCGATTTWSHDPVNSCNPTPLFHTDYCEYCQCYYYVSHSFQFYGIIESDSNGHYVQCHDCEYIKQVSHVNEVDYDENGHYNHCIICGYEGSIVQHTPLFNCNSIDPHDHYMYCSGCDYTLDTTLVYSICAEYDHYCKCQICNLQILEAHEEDCTYYDDELHIYYCDLCKIQYLMPHFVNEHVIIYENYEPGYDLWVCTYCGYMEVRRREE